MTLATMIVLAGVLMAQTEKFPDNPLVALRDNAAQFALPIPPQNVWKGNYGATIEPTILFADKYAFELGGVKFEVFHTPGETSYHLTVWIPQYKAAFVGDNYYDSFPNIYTLRGTQPRWALDYVNSLNKVPALKPEIMLPSHGLPVHGYAEIVKRVTRYRDAIQYVHDETVKGMNAGQDVWTIDEGNQIAPCTRHRRELWAIILVGARN